MGMEFEKKMNWEKELVPPLQDSQNKWSLSVQHIYTDT